jgi:polar amino acid transport system substrate-binding protein
MRRPARALACLAILALAGSAPAPAKDWVALNSLRWPPYFLDDANRPGFARELLDTCVSAQGYETRFSPLPIEEMYSSLRSGVLDAHVLSYDKSREGFVFYGKAPLFSDTYRPVVRAGTGIKISSLADFDRLRIGHLKGLRYTEAYHDYVNRRIEAGGVVEADTNEQLLKLLLEGKVDVFVSLDSTTRWLARSNGSLPKIQVLPYDIKTSVYFLAVSKRSRIKDKQAFLAAFDRCVQGMREDGSYQKLLAKYGIE